MNTIKTSLVYILILSLCIIGLVGCNHAPKETETTTDEVVTYDVVKRNYHETYLNNGEAVDWNWNFTLIRPTKNSKAESFLVNPITSTDHMYTFSFQTSDPKLVIKDGKVYNEGLAPGDYTITVTVEADNIKNGKAEMTIPIRVQE